MTVGERAGEHFPLDSQRLNQIGRGLDCQIVLTDPLCSRIHAIVECIQGRWHARDNGSRNGTFVNDRKIDDALLSNGCSLRVGSTEFTFSQSLDPPKGWEQALRRNQALTQTIVRDSLVEPHFQAPAQLGALQDSPQVRQLLLLYQFTIRQLGLGHPDEVVRVSLDLLKEQTNSSLVGFLWSSDDGHLRPKLVLPEDDELRAPLSESLTQKVAQEQKAVWVSDHQTGELTDSLKHFADAICVPLVNEAQLLGAIHLYLQQGRFTQEDFEFAISIAGITAVALERAYREERLQSDFDRLRAKTGNFDELVGESPPMRELKERIARLGPTSGSVLVLGESGTGKELVARALHRHSSRADRPMLAVNCAAIPDNLMESQLFGHKAGSFTGADRDHQGYFQQADGGTLFLDEAGEMNLAGQAKLLRILEGHPFMPVGSTKEVSVDVRVIAATNQDLKKYVQEKKFREDLYYRLSVFELRIPPLRERGEDIELLIDHFFAHFRSQHGRPKLKLSAAAKTKLLGYHWPGNVRQLRNVLDSAVVLAVGDSIQPSDLGLRDAGEEEPETLNLEMWEERLIQKALKRTKGDVPEAAKLLGLARATLYRKINQYKIER